MRRVSFSGCSVVRLLLVLPFAATPAFAADGLDDPGGYSSYPFDLNSAATDLAYGCAVQPDGKIVLAGAASTNDEGGHKIAITRLQPNGLADPAFNGGEVVISLTGQVTGEKGQARAVAIDGQGRILIGGTLHETAFFNRDIGFVTRLLSDGTIDGSWDNGYFAGWFLDGGMTTVAAMGFDPSGRLWTTGPELAGGTGPWRFQLMSDFGNDIGWGSIPFTGFVATAPTSLAFAPDGNVIFGGWALRGAPSHLASFAVARVLGSTLALDPSFGLGGDGRAVFDYAHSSYVRAVGLQPDRRIVLAGESGPLGQEQVAVLRLDPNGGFGSAWGHDVGFTFGSTTASGGGGLNRMVVQSDGKVVVAAATYTEDPGNIVDVGVARLTAAGSLDTTFGGGGSGKRTFDMPPVGSSNGSDTLTCLALSSGKAVLVGSGRYSGSDWDFSLRRLTSDLIFAGSFEAGSTWTWSLAVP
jgi:uncharacterized delta-60 repeat protein